MLKRIFGLALALTLAACNDAAVLGPDARPDGRSAQVGPDRAGPPGLSVLTRNLYVGADIEAALAAPADPDDPLQLPALVAELWQDVLDTRFEERAGALADEIAELRPHLVGLQEVSEFRIQSPGDFVTGVVVPNASETDVRLDFLALLLEALADHGLAYRVAATSDNFDIEMPMLAGFGPAGPQFDDIRLLDADVVLAREDVETSNARAETFDAVFAPVVGGLPLEIRRGFVTVDVEVDGVGYRFANTHLEPVGEGGADIHLAQAAQLMADLASAPGPVILVGDLNTGPDAGSGSAYDGLLDAGFVDGWGLRGPGGDGATCCHAADLLNPASELTDRIDLVLYRDGFTASGRPFQGAFATTVVGEEPSDRTPSGLWPSDHAGVGAVLRPAPVPPPARLPLRSP